MFARPGVQTIYMEARIRYRDGAQNLWPIGRQDNLNWVGRLQNERAHKMMEYAFDKNRYSWIYPQIALWAARRNFSDADNPPVSIDLVRRWSGIPEPPAGLNISAITKRYGEIVYTQTIRSDELQI